MQHVFDCSTLMIKSNKPLNQELAEEDLPPINFRISMNYGLVEVALGSNNKEVDLFGSVVNECAKSKQSVLIKWISNRKEFVYFINQFNI